MRLGGKTALVTGANRGIGRELAEALSREGARVVVNHPLQETEAHAVVEAIRRCGGEAAAISADVGCLTDIESMFREVRDRFGALHVLINNAGIDPGPTQFLQVDEAAYDRVMSVNLKGAYFCSRFAAEEMIRTGPGGKIINITSVHTRQTVLHRSIYAAAKGGLEALTRALALDLAEHRINVNAIAPGFIEVERSIRQTPNYSREMVGATIPWGRVGLPEDLAELAIFLASPASDYLTGQVIAVDGGLTCKLAR